MSQLVCLSDSRTTCSLSLPGSVQHQVTLEALSEQVWRVQVSDPDENHIQLDSFAIENERELGSKALNLTLEEASGSWTLRSTPGGKTSIIINQINNQFTFDLVDSRTGKIIQKGLSFASQLETIDTLLFNKEENSKYQNHVTEQHSYFATSVKFSTQNKESAYGFGEKAGLLSKAGRSWRMWNYDNYAYSFDSDPLYQSIPFLMFHGSESELGHGLFIDTVSRQVWDLTQYKNGATTVEESSVSVKVDRYGTMSMYLFAAESPLSLIQQFVGLTGRTELPPLYALGFQQCRWSYYPEDRVREISNGFIERDIPADVFYLDIDYMERFKCFTVSKEHFPDVKRMANDLLLKNRQRIVSIIDPGISKEAGYHVYEDGTKENVWCTLKGENYVETVWPEICSFPDFFSERVRQWWGKYYKNLMDCGIQAFWNDMNEPAVFNDTTFKTFSLSVKHTLDRKNVSSDDKKSLDIIHHFVHNAYGMLMAKASREGIQKLQPNQRPFLLTRSGYAGVQKYAWSWSGDNNSIYEDMKMSIAMLLNMSLTGQVIVGADVGGFAKDCHPELYARWIGMASLCYPFFRSHSTKDTIEQNPWAFGEECENACRYFIKLRYQLIPYIYTHVRNACNKNVDYAPFLRPLWMEFPKCSQCYDEQWENTQFFFGPSLMVAPILIQGQTSRSVYLPPHTGGWYNFFDRTHYEGGQVVEFKDITLDKMIVLVKAGSIIPMRSQSKQSVYDTLTQPLKFEIFAHDEASDKLMEDHNVVYLDDGFTNDYLNNKFGLYKLVNLSGTIQMELIEGEGHPSQITQEQVDALYFVPFIQSSSNCTTL